MLWFKHMSNANGSELLMDFVDEYGADGYGVWWLIIEKIASAMTQDDPDLCTFECSIQSWARHCRVTKARFIKISSVLGGMGLLSLETKNNSLSITFEHLKTLRDEYTERAIRRKTYDAVGRKSVGTMSGQCRDSVRPRVEKSREEQNRTETQGESAPKVSERDRLQEAGFGSLDKNEEAIALLRRQKATGVTDEAIHSLLSERAKELQWRIGDRLPATKYSGKTSKGQIVSLLEDDFTIDDLKAIIDYVLNPDSWNAQENVRGLTYIFRPDKAEDLLRKSKTPIRKKVNGREVNTPESMEVRLEAARVRLGLK